MKPGVYTASKKDGSKYYRSSLTYKGKHISLGSFLDEEKANQAYLEAHRILADERYDIESFHPDHTVLDFKKWVILINYRDNHLYIKTPIYMKKKYFLYYLTPELIYIFDVDDLFYYSTHSIIKRGGHLFVSDYGMQYNILARYGIKNFAVPGKDYYFVNGDTHDFRYENIQIINRFHGVTRKEYNGRYLYETKIHVNGDLLVGRYRDDITAAIAYNKAAEVLLKKGIPKEFPANFIEELQTKEYRSIYKAVTISKRINLYPEYTGKKEQT